MFATPASLPRAHPAAQLCSAYTQVSVQSAAAADRSGHELVRLLYEGFEAAVARARGALQRGDTAARGQAIDHALQILGEGLRAGLNLREGGKLAADLDALYAYVTLRLTQAHLRSDDAALAECVGLIRPLHEAWLAIGPQVRRAS
jgi:flagellar protein FliS